MYLSAAGSWPAATLTATMPSLTPVPTTCPATQINVVLALPRARFAPKVASTISTGQMTR
jgi:hypothetical protein